MSKKPELKIDIKPTVNRSVADFALSLVNIFLNQNYHLCLSLEQEMDGERNYKFVANKKQEKSS